MKTLTYEQLLTKGVQALDDKFTPELIPKLLNLMGILKKWSRVHNLTTVTKPRDIIVKHFLDSLSIGSLLQGPAILDVGTGAGFPGLPLACAYPNYQFTLLDARAKRTHFLTQAIYALKLTNVEVIHARVEDFQSQTWYTTVISRAFSELVQFVSLTERLVAYDGVLLAMKGACSEEELASIASKPFHRKVVNLKVPYLDAERSAVILKKVCEK